MPFGVKNAPAVFQELMQSIFREDSQYCSPYMDDLIIFSRNWEDHCKHVRIVLGKLRAAGLTANPAKCKWGGNKMEFLEHLVGESTMPVPEHRIEALKNYSRWPLNCKLGGVNPKREFTQVGKGLLGMGSRPAARGRKEREFHRIVSPRGVTQLDST